MRIVKEGIVKFNLLYKCFLTLMIKRIAFGLVEDFLH